MRGRFVPCKARGRNGSGQHRLAECDSAKRRRVEATERVKRISLDCGPFNGLIEKAQVKCGVVADEYRTITALFADRAPDFTEYALQRIALVDGGPQWVIGIDPVYRKRCRIHVGSGKRLDVVTMCFTAPQHTVFAEFDKYGGNLEQRIRLRVEAAGFYVDDDRQEAAEAFRHDRFHFHLVPCLQDFLVEQQADRVAYAEAGDLGRDVGEAAFAVARGEIDVDPGRVVFDELGKETAGQYVVSR